MNDEFTIGRLAKTMGLSRSTLLYYDRIGLLRPINRSRGNYRLYSASEVRWLRQIRTYRQMGIPLKQIGELIRNGDDGAGATETMLRRHLQSLDAEIETLRKQQRQVVLLLSQITSGTSAKESGVKKARRRRAPSKGPQQQPKLEEDMIKKDRWVEIMRAAGLTDDDMKNWHRQFERLEPEAHQELLESLGIETDEIASIREWSKA
jgi:DNA-binding transcriptional MerR regulator